MIRKPVGILVLLTGLNLLNYLDRFVLSAVLPAVQTDLRISNFLGGLLATVFLVGYFVTSPTFGQMADRGARKGIVAAGVAVWSAATLATGLAVGPISLILARATVGVGEASYATLAPTIIDDMAPPKQRGRWLSVFYVAMPFGAALGYIVGGEIERRFDWRSAFFVAGGPGLLLAALCLLIKEPARKLAPEKIALRQSAATLWKVLLYRRGVAGYCAQTFAIGGFAYWAPKFLVMRFAIPLHQADFKFGAITLVSGLVGTAIGGVWSDRWLRKVKPTDPDDHTATTINLRVCALASAVAAPLAVLCFLAPSAGAFFGLAFACELFLFLSTSPINAVILRSVPVEMRASAMALSIFAIHALGDLWSPPLLGLLLDHVPAVVAMMCLPAAIALSGAAWWRPVTIAPAPEHAV